MYFDTDVCKLHCKLHVWKVHCNPNPIAKCWIFLVLQGTARTEMLDLEDDICRSHDLSFHLVLWYKTIKCAEYYLIQCKTIYKTIQYIRLFNTWCADIKLYKMCRIPCSLLQGALQAEIWPGNSAHVHKVVWSGGSVLNQGEVWLNIAFPLQEVCST